MVKQPSHSSELASKTILSMKPQPPLIQAKHWGIFFGDISVNAFDIVMIS